MKKTNKTILNFYIFLDNYIRMQTDDIFLIFPEKKMVWHFMQIVSEDYSPKTICMKCQNRTTQMKARLQTKA